MLRSSRILYLISILIPISILAFKLSMIYTSIISFAIAAPCLSVSLINILRSRNSNAIETLLLKPCTGI